MASDPIDPSSTKTRILYQHQVSPPVGSVPDSSVPLSFFDAAWLFTGPLERLFFFSVPKISTIDFTSTHLPSLQSSLSQTLKQFYPLAGRVRPCPNPSPDNQFEFYFSPTNDSIPFCFAETSSDFDELTSNEAKKFEELYSLVPQLPRANDGTTPLTAIQVTLFPQKGFSIGISVHHVACDDLSFMHFVQSWAATCWVGSEPVPPPLFDRALVPDPNRLYFKTLSEMKEMLSNGPPPPQSDQPPVEQPQPLISSFILTREQIDMLKNGVISKFNDSNLHCSAFTVACAYAWVCLINSQEENNNKNKNEKAHLLFSVECRARMDPPIPKGYFGNCLRPCFVEAEMDDLQIFPQGAFNAAREIGKAIKELENGVLEGAEGWFRKILSLLPNRPMSIGGSPRFRVYDSDFGFGKPVKVELPTIQKTPGTVSLAESRDGKGGIEIGVVMTESEMRRFEKCFVDGLLRI
ncbi:hypothetical protein LUZ60_006901 [Juncus effusus]|nr:hypothetical protein LUZ60_006901 [Juncus effusus]